MTCIFISPTHAIISIADPRPDGIAKAQIEVLSYSTANAMKIPPNMCEKALALSGK